MDNEVCCLCQHEGDYYGLLYWKYIDDILCSQCMWYMENVLDAMEVLRVLRQHGWDH